MTKRIRMSPAEVASRFREKAEPFEKSFPENDMQALADLAAAVEEIGHTVSTLEQIVHKPTVLLNPTPEQAAEIEAMFRGAGPRGAMIIPDRSAPLRDRTIAALQLMLTDCEIGPRRRPTPADRVDSALEGIWTTVAMVNDLLVQRGAALNAKGRADIAQELAKLIACAIEIAACLPGDPVDLQAEVDDAAQTICTARNRGIAGR